MMSFNRHFFIPLTLLALLAGCRDETSAVNNPAPLVPSTLAADFGTNALLRVQRLCALGPRDALAPGAETAAFRTSACLPGRPTPGAAPPEELTLTVIASPMR